MERYRPREGRGRARSRSVRLWMDTALGSTDRETTAIPGAIAPGDLTAKTIFREVWYADN